MSFYQDRILPYLVNVAMRQGALTEYRHRLVPAAEGRILEIGVGSGLNLPFYAEKGKHVIGLDPSPTMDERQAPVAERVRSYLNALVRDSKSPGIQYLVVAPEQTVFEYAGGWADLARHRPMDPATTLMSYSMSKTITAAAALQLVEAQKVELDDSIDRYLDSHPYGPSLTVRQLLSHTSGIPNPIPLVWVHSVARHDTFDESAALATVLREHPRLSFTPGTKYGYSNIGYWLLGRIVERASGETFTSYVGEHVLRPLAIGPQELGYAIPNAADHARGYLERYSLMNLVKGFLVDRDRRRRRGRLSRHDGVVSSVRNGHSCDDQRNGLRRSWTPGHIGSSISAFTRATSVSALT